MYKEFFLKREKGFLLALHLYKLEKKLRKYHLVLLMTLYPYIHVLKAPYLFMMLLFYVFYTCICYRIYIYEILLQIIRPGLNILIQFIQTLLHAVCEAGSEHCRSRKIHL